MPSLFQQIIIAFLLGLAVGSVLRTRWEEKARWISGKRYFFSGGSTLAILAEAILIDFPLALALFFLPPILTLNFFDLLPLRGTENQLFFLFYISAIGLGKLARYAWWRWRFRRRHI
ncbi:hypothetical protein [Undibacterium pigrum]|uniref:hypothetical protein n=1 Tax=Undibacterium pigrum TaxID=401470 RepID=UPI0011B69CE8|nr:hypothetical protein [Undibacterium pigrum]